MSGNHNSTLRQRLAGLGVFAQAVVVAGVVLAVWLLVAPAGYAISGTSGVIAAAVGAALCLVGAVPAVTVSAFFHGPNAAMYALAVGMLARTLVPMALGVVVHLSVPSLAAAGMIFYLLIFYVVALVVETALTLAKVPSGRASSGKAI